MKIFTAAQISNWDQYTITQEPITAVDLMERAATASFEWIKKNISLQQPVVVCCGTGNNGGDGLVIARLLLKAKYNVSVYTLNSKKNTEAYQINHKKLKLLHPGFHEVNTIKDFPSFPKNTVVIEALFGTGITQPLRGIAAAWVIQLNNQQLQIISIDMPAGLCADHFSAGNAIIKAAVTLSFETNKLVFLLPGIATYIGKIELLPIGLNKNYYAHTPTRFETVDTNTIREIYKPRDAFAHKYNFGHALIYAGSKNMMGAAVLCTKACIRSGTGLATIQVSPDCEAIIHISIPEAITTSAEDNEKKWVKKTAIAIGPGLEIIPKNKQLLKKLIANKDTPLVIDASAIVMLAGATSLLPLRKIHPAIITPHGGEFEKLFGKTNNPFEQLELAMEKAHSLNCYIVLKGHHTLIACPDGTGYFNTTGNAGMATAGSGDVLTGILCGLLAQGYSEKDSCIFGVYLHGLAGDIAAENYTQEAMISRDIIDGLSTAFKQIKNY